MSTTKRKQRVDDKKKWKRRIEIREQKSREEKKFSV